MAHHNKHHAFRRRHNPFGITGGVVKDAMYNTAGALASLFVAGQFGMSGWANVGVTAAAAVAASFAGKAVAGAPAGEEALKGGLTATIISALHQLGFAQSLGLGMYANAWFAVPTASDQYLRTSSGNVRGIALPAPVAAVPAGVSGYQRYRSRYFSRYQ